MLSEVLNGLHDAELVGLDSGDAPARLRIKLKTPEDIDLSITFEQCMYYRVTDFTCQNVLSRALVFDENSPPGEAIGSLLRWLTSLSDSTSFLTESKLTELIQAIYSGQLRLVYLEPSCGAEVAILCQKFHRD